MKKYKITPKLNGKTLTRGCTSTTDSGQVETKLIYAATRAPKFDTLVLTMLDGTEKEFSPAEIKAIGWVGGKSGKSATANGLKKAKKVVKTTKIAKRTKKVRSGEDGEEESEEGECGHSAKCKGHGTKFCNHKASLKRHETAGKKVGVIDSVVEFCRAAVDDGGITVGDLVKKLAKRFKDRPEDSMRTTVRCQVSRDLPKKGLKFRNQKDKDGKHTRYAIVN